MNNSGIYLRFILASAFIFASCLRANAFDLKKSQLEIIAAIETKLPSQRTFNRSASFERKLLGETGWLDITLRSEREFRARAELRRSPACVVVFINSGDEAMLPLLSSAIFDSLVKTDSEKLEICYKLGYLLK